ncbi:FtsX-like permease family protein [Acrocarpospora sp. B8E8]|uniref:ABC transporter permease n=1 Tax=Acrocarpospora sp. B8E8 TaxID=3153572 RepID=UPI00325E3833
MAEAAARLNWPVAIVAGLRFALERWSRRGPGQATPVRSALIGSIIGVLGVMAAITFAAGVADAARNPIRYGQNHQLIAFLGVNGAEAASAEILPVLARDPDVTGAEARKMSVAAVGEVTFGVFSVAGSVPIALVTGRPPANSGEILLAAGTAGRLGVVEGDRIQVTGSRGGRDFEVSGIGFVTEGPANGYADGALTTPDGYAALFSSFDIDMGIIALRPGADPFSVLTRLKAALHEVPGGERVGLLPALIPVQLAQIQGGRGLPIALGAFLGVLAMAAVAHAVTATIRRRRHEIAVMRALGLTPAQSRAAVVTQALTIAAIAAGVGVPLGLALGRSLWRVVAENTPLSYVAPAPLWAMVSIGPAVLAAALVLAALPARSAGRFRLAGVLRAE